MEDESDSGSDALKSVLSYHDITKHRFQAYAHGPGYLDWATQPDPFRRYSGACLVPLERILPTPEPLYDDVFVPGCLPPTPVTLRTISQLFYDSLAISAWKSTGEARWALRVNPSSGNLHPTEGYLICGRIAGLFDVPTVSHYAPKEHGLEARAQFGIALWDQLVAGFSEGTFLVGLTSIHWREAWKYGQRAYRYCQHDVGHAIGAMSIAAAGLGWRTHMLDDLGADELALLLGTGRHHDAEPEEPEVLIAVEPSGEDTGETQLPEQPISEFEFLDWRGQPSHLSPSHVDWGVEEAATAARPSRGRRRYEQLQRPPTPYPAESRPVSLRRVIRQRRSAVSMDKVTRITRDAFYRMLFKTLPVYGAVPFSTLPWKPHIHLAVFVHRVDDLPTGLYILVRDPSQQTALEQTLTKAEHWRRPVGCPPQLELYCLIEGDTQQAARQVSCFQDIASDGCFSLGMLAEYERPLQQHGPWFYPRLFWEAGAIGQVLYLEAEAAGIRSTGIGCYFDDAMHDVLGLRDRAYQDLYHFTIGGPVEDTRLTTLPSYPDDEMLKGSPVSR